jgi:hypothetical protein
MAVAGHRSKTGDIDARLDDLSDDEAEESGRELLDELLLRAHRAAIRLDKTAEYLTGIAWLILGLAVAIGFVGAVILSIIVRGPGPLGFGLALIVVAFLTFLPMYFAPTWARAYAAKLLVDVEQQWRAVV